MKRIILTVSIIGVLLGGAYLLSKIPYQMKVENKTASSTKVISQPIITPEQAMNSATELMIQSAINASSTDIEKAKAIASAKVEGEIKLKIEREVRSNMQKMNNARQEEIEKKLSF